MDYLPPHLVQGVSDMSDEQLAQAYAGVVALMEVVGRSSRSLCALRSVFEQPPPLRTAAASVPAAGL